MPESSASELEMAVEELRRYKAPSIAQIPSEWIQSGDKIICSDIN
jgi:hypothetical protein